MKEKLKSAQIRTVKQGNLSAECFMIQVWGPQACDTCEFKNRKNCGGKEIRKTGKNEKGKEVPVE